MKAALACILFATLLVGGCATYQDKPISPEGSSAGLDARSLDNAGLRRFLEANGDAREPWPRDEWGLRELTLAAFYYHPSLQWAQEAIRVAEAGVRTAGERPNPTLSVTPSYDFSPGTHGPWSPLIDFDLPIETAGKRTRRVEEAEHNTESARFAAAAAAWQIRAAVRSGLVDLVASERRSQLLMQRSALERQIVGRLRQRLEVGDIGTEDLAIQKVALAQAQADAAGALHQAATARAGLAQALGLPLAALDGRVFAFDLSRVPDEGALVTADARRQAIVGRADVRAALADYAATQSALRLEIAKQYPDIHLGPGYSWNQQGEGESEAEIGVSLELPILNRNEGPIAEAEARRSQAAARFLAVQATAMADVDRAIAAYQASRKNLTAVQSVASAQRDADRSVQTRVKEGEADPLDILNAELEVNGAGSAETSALVQLQQDIGALEAAVQSQLKP